MEKEAVFWHLHFFRILAPKKFQHNHHIYEKINEKVTLESEAEFLHLSKKTRIRNGRGKTRGKGLERMRKSMGSKKKIEIPVGKERPTKPTQSAKLSNELGIIARNFLSLPNKWKELTREDKGATLIRCHIRSLYSCNFITVSPVLSGIAIIHPSILYSCNFITVSSVLSGIAIIHPSIFSVNS
ncbi:uncharacterized protein LOC132043876 [Lycium ferocissimum]|uniref:uncharacterized protein LOC132043876 n=1 Tax=Lycium ferocissimum TaxID=112874 RepID=UPI002814AC41|nr:uncharacterized protein LOC132043876 [Lycium ferocissimum]